jgi:hypothetical protein
MATHFRLDSADEYNHDAGEVTNFNESMYFNAIDHGDRAFRYSTASARCFGSFRNATRQFGSDFSGHQSMRLYDKTHDKTHDDLRDDRAA